MLIDGKETVLKPGDIVSYKEENSFGIAFISRGNKRIKWFKDDEKCIFYSFGIFYDTMIIMASSHAMKVQEIEALPGAIHSFKFNKEEKSVAKKTFRDLVQNLIDKSDLFEVWVNPICPEHKLTVLDAIESESLATYLVNTKTSDRKTNALLCLIAIYRHLEKENPDQNTTNTLINDLRECL